ncbi:hypothetical protein SDRG_15668 [Saprolegnia diclina VS20]|uniref:Amine oxidase domain-containing protein n=1 Tax=Saprolegnia diclina (strain VS20) TaxID=1156394 RepID=T0PZI4_SAPDV|nr:hypothetical protein SDRG_15668 [Saprolegnia diclina VS20]EQC26490.1 hypothetical protein SDRG_15668 [Saprolegnia diclina VS20]|eukprot:XP_008620069.1 hypothetical protein SDRG_15668 [Saprolegnia diclina VS20]
MRASILLSCLAGLAGVTATAPVCILGAGPSGLASALRLAEKGITDVVIFDKKDGPGGKTENWVSPEGFNHHIGAIFGDTTMYPLSIELLDKFNVERPLIALPQEYFYNVETGTILDASTLPSNATAAVAAMQRYAAVYAKYAAYIRPGFPNGVPAEIAAPMAAFVAANHLEPLLPLFHVYLTACGYGSLHDLPTMHALAYIKPSLFVQFATHQSTIFITDYHLLFAKIASSLTHATFRYSATIASMDRRADGASIMYTVNGKGPQTQACASIINTIPHRLDLLQPLGLDAQEVDVFKHVETVQYFTTVWTLDHVEPQHQYSNQLQLTGNAAKPLAFGEPLGDGAPVIFYTQPSDTKYFNVYSYKRGKDVISLENVTALAQSTLSQLNKNVSEPGAVATPLTAADLRFSKSWDYFAHVSPTTVANGWHAALAKLQGHRSTYHTGAVRFMETVECSIASAFDLVDTYFSSHPAC